MVQSNDKTIINVGNLGIVGNPSALNSKITISENQSYIYSCFIKASTNTVIEIGCKAYQLDGTEINFGISGVNNYKSYQNYQTINPNVIYRLDTFLKSYNRSDTVINSTKDLLIKPNTYYIAPYIKSISGSFEIHNVVIKPVKTYISTGFIQSKDVIGIFFKNKSAEPTNKLIKQLKSYLFSYKNTIYYEEDGLNSLLLDELPKEEKSFILNNKNKYFSQWINTSITKIMDGKKYRKIYDLNNPDIFKWVLVSINQKDFSCIDNYVFQESKEKTDCNNPFIYNGKKYNARYKQIIRDKNCNISPNALYYYSSKDECYTCTGRNTEPIWISSGKIIRKICDTQEIIAVPLTDELINTHLFELQFDISLSKKSFKIGEGVGITYKIKNIGQNDVSNIVLKGNIPNEINLDYNSAISLSNSSFATVFSVSQNKEITLLLTGTVVFGNNRKLHINSDLYFADGVNDDSKPKYSTSVDLKLN